ncbi:MAG TPA: MFS transporter [Bacteroidales bacterium]|nr:MFS transporter [Bacteroidales bacterium]
MKRTPNALAATPIFLAFLCMGFGDVAGPLTGLVKEEFNLSNAMAQLIPFMGFIMFGLLSLPMGIYQDRKGKKFILMLGLILALFGLVLPIIGNYSTFSLLLLSILLLGAGAATLQVAGNPIMRDVSPEGKYSRNLSLGQFVKAIGSLSGALIPLLAVAYWGADWRILFPIYSAFLLLTIVILSLVRIPRTLAEKVSTATFKSTFRLMGNPYIFMMVMAIFVYVGAEVSMSSQLPIFLENRYGIDLATLGIAGTGLFFVSLMIGRFLGGVILNWIRPRTFLTITLLLSLVGLAGLFIQNQIAAIISIIVIGMSFANIFPLIFSITVDWMPHRSNELSGLMVTAIVGGAFIPPIMGLVADNIGIMLSFIVPMICILYILYVALIGKRKGQQPAFEK